MTLRYNGYLESKQFSAIETPKAPTPIRGSPTLLVIRQVNGLLVIASSRDLQRSGGASVAVGVRSQVEGLGEFTLDGSMLGFPLDFWLDVGLA